MANIGVSDQRHQIWTQDTKLWHCAVKKDCEKKIHLQGLHKKKSSLVS